MTEAAPAEGPREHPASPGPSVAAIVLAAGQSRRMGVQKLLLPFGDRPLIALIVDEVLRSKAQRAVVVISGQNEAVRRALEERAVTFAVNPDPNSEMLDSVRCGIQALPPDWSSVLLVLGDQPGITAPLIDRLIAAQIETGKSLVLPSFEGRRGHPLLIGAKHRDEILKRHDSTGLRGLLHGHLAEVLELPVPASLMIEDMDLPEDYERLLPLSDPSRRTMR